MTPTSFTFTVTMPGNPQFVGAIRQLAIQTATYAQLPPKVAEGLGTVVQRETDRAIASTQIRNAPIEFRFSGDEATVTVTISCEAAPSVEPPRSSAAAGVSVAWNADGSRHTCQIRQPTAA